MKTPLALVLFSAATICGLATGAVGSDLTLVPNDLASVEGNSEINVLTGTRAFRYQQVFDASQFSGGPQLISELRLRPETYRDGDLSSPVLSRPASITIPNIQIQLSTTLRDPDGLSTTFADNVGLDAAPVFSGNLQFSSAMSGPPPGGPPGTPRDFDISIPLQTPFLYDPSQGNLLLDFKKYLGTLANGNTNDFFFIDAHEVAGDSISSVFVGGGVADGFSNATPDLPMADLVSTRGHVVQFVSEIVHPQPPTTNSRNYQPPAATPPTPGFVDRIAQWNDSSQTWDPVAPGDLSSGKVHVLVHGWGRGERQWVENNPALSVWDMTRESNGIDSSFFSDFQSVTSSIQQSYSGSSDEFHVVAFSWIDASATQGEVIGFPGRPAFNEPRASQSQTKGAGELLASALSEAGIGGLTSQLHLIGHSHGSKVAAIAAVALEEQQIQVNHLTLMDSPESTPALPDHWYEGAYNELAEGELIRLDIGPGANQTFVDNYYSFFSARYDVPGVVNIDLNPEGVDIFDPSGSHSYPVNWYAETTALDNGFALDWSTLTGGDPSSLAEDYKQFFLLDPHELAQVVVLGPHNPSRKQSFGWTTVGIEGEVNELPSGQTMLKENSPAFWDVLFEIGPSDHAIEFSYEFLNIGDGDQLGLWIDDNLRFLLTGQVVGDGVNSSIIDISDLDAGQHFLTVGLHSIGQPNAEIVVGSFKMLSAVPEPNSAVQVIIAFLVLYTGTACRRAVSSTMHVTRCSA